MHKTLCSSQIVVHPEGRICSRAAGFASRTWRAEKITVCARIGVVWISLGGQKNHVCKGGVRGDRLLLTSPRDEALQNCTSSHLGTNRCESFGYQVIQGLRVMISLA